MSTRIDAVRRTSKEEAKSGWPATLRLSLKQLLRMLPLPLLLPPRLTQITKPRLPSKLKLSRMQSRTEL